MSRCGCSGATCSCQIVGAGAITVTGSGTITNPYVVSGGLSMQVADTGTVDMAVSGSGTQDDPYVLAGHATMTLGDLMDVDTSTLTTGYVLARQADGQYALVPPATAAPGAINKGTGLSGDGSAGSPLQVRLAAASGLELTPTGLRVLSTGAWAAYTPQLRTSRDEVVPIPAGSSLRGRFRRDGNTVHLNINLLVGSNFPTRPGLYMLTLPTPDEGSMTQLLDVHMILPELSTSTNFQYSERQGLAKLEGDGYITRIGVDNGAYSMQFIGASFPRWGASTKLHVSGSYEAKT